MTLRFFLLITIVFASVPAHAWTEGRLGAGFGVGMLYGYGGGIKLDYRFDDHLAVSLGQGGYTPSVGLQWYFREPTERWQPRFGMHHGVVDTLSVGISSGPSDNRQSRRETFRDFYVELGNHISFGHKKNHAVEFAFAYALGDGGKARRQDELGYSDWDLFSSVDKSIRTFNLGYRYNF